MGSRGMVKEFLVVVWCQLLWPGLILFLALSADNGLSRFILCLALMAMLSSNLYATVANQFELWREHQTKHIQEREGFDA